MRPSHPALHLFISMTHTHLDDLQTLIDSAEKPPRFAVIGNPVAHSLSPQLHQPALDALGIDASYVRVEVPEGRVAEAFEKMRAVGFRGINVTVPHKLDALEACDRVDPGARLMGAVNTIVFHGEDKVGFNTDGPGFVRAIREDFGVDLSDLRIVIIGAGGGAGRAIATQCCLEDCPQLTLGNRTVEKLVQMRDLLDPLLHGDKLEGPGDRLSIHALDDPALEVAISNSELIINTTSVGLKQSDPSPIPSSWIEPHHLVYDTIYNPAKTRLLRDAQDQGARTANGLSLLLHQGALSLEYWTNKDAPIEAMRAGLIGAIKA
ncbi:shikimate dehydrogenase [Akkermansiaceae bacterium]|nr:shikimate dehydrogenase [Akkermansiaceae bacterium]MDB4386607.1 shikimate dehydrogenase [Akkermansiaceae bacterium]MDB4585335.1 shikimate dehydrogenase [Akkermansiaceae bacterium]MDB4820133.1 shikimate dehydrogenase [Akkermansiaceae bacterium]